MTIIEMHTKCDLLMDKAGAPWFNATEKDVFLNMAQYEFTKREARQFEVNEEARQNLGTIVLQQAITSVTVNLDTLTRFGYVAALSATYTDNCGNQKTSPVSPMQWDDYWGSLRDPFNKPSDKYPVHLLSFNGTNRILEIKGITTFVSGNLVYIKKPVVVLNDEVTPANNVNCELPEFVHDEVVNIAVRKMLAIAKDPNYQAQINEIINQQSSNPKL